MSEVMVLDGFTLPAHVLGATKESDFGKVGGLPKITMFKAPLKFIDAEGVEQRVPGQFKIMKGELEQVLQAPIPVVILGITPTGTALNRAFYAGDYIPGTNAAPDCASSNGIVPDSGDLPQAVSCSICPHAQWGSKGKGQACSQGKTLFVAGANDPAGEMYQVRIPPTSLKNLSLYGSRITATGAHFPMLITNLGLLETEEVDYPILSLSLGGWLEAEPAQTSQIRADSVEVLSMIVQQGAPAVVALPAQPAPVAQPAVVAQPVAAAQPVVQEPVIAAAFQQPAPVQAAPIQAPASVQPEVQSAPVQAAPIQAPASAQPEVQPEAQPAAVEQPAASDPLELGVDSEGAYWSESLHSSGKTKIKNGTWKKRKGAGAAQPAAVAQPVAAPVQEPVPGTQQPIAGESAPLDAVLGMWLPKK